jgi:signal transduction histidine kinase
MWGWLNSIRGLLFLGALTISIIPLALMIAWVTQNAIDNQFDAVREKHLIVAQNLASSLSRYVEDAVAEFDVITQLSDADLSTDWIVKSAKNFHFRLFAAFDAMGVETRSKVFDDDLAQAKLDENLVLFLREEANKKPGEISITGITSYKSKPHFWIVRSIRDGGLQTMLVRPDYLRKTQKAIAFGERGHSMIVDQYGRVIAHPNAQWEETSKDASKLSVVKKMMAGEIGVSQFFSPPMQADMIAGHTFVPETGWGVMVPQPVQELYDAAKDFQKVAFFIALAGLIIAIALNWWLSRIIGGSVSKLSSASKTLIKDDDLTKRVTVPGSKSPIEIYELSVTYNQMLERIEQQSNKLSESLKESEAANQAKSEFLATITHELRTPMNGIVGSLELIKDASDCTEAVDYADMAMNASHHLIELIEDVLLYSSVEAGKIEIKKAPLDPRFMIEQVYKSFSDQAESKGIEFKLNLSNDLPTSVEGDEKRLRQILVNIVGNALKFTDSGSVEIQSHIEKSGPSEKRFIIDVIDTGPGIASDKQTQIFDRFFQIDSSLNRVKGGTGLGLAISQDLARLMRGIISVESEEGKGSRFTIEIPIKNQQDAA